MFKDIKTVKSLSFKIPKLETGKKSRGSSAITLREKIRETMKARPKTQENV